MYINIEKRKKMKNLHYNKCKVNYSVQQRLKNDFLLHENKQLIKKSIMQTSSSKRDLIKISRSHKVSPHLLHPPPHPYLGFNR